MATTNKKITELPELTEANLSDDDVLAIVDISAGTTNKVRKSTLASALSGVASLTATSPVTVNSSTGNINIAVTTVPVANGGTGATSFTNKGVLLGGTTVSSTTAGSSGQVLTSNGSGTAPTFQSTSANIPNVAPGTSGNLVTSNGSAWTSAALSANIPDVAPGTSGNVVTSNGSAWTSAAPAAASSVAADNITAGDAAVLLTTSSGNITVDAAASDSDIIFKGTDGGADTTFLTIDGSAAGAATFNSSVDAASLTLTTDLAVAHGGTGGSTASAARSNLGAAALGSNSDITALTGLTTDLSVAQGGTGASTHTAGSVLMGADTSAITSVGPATSGNVLTSNGSAWTSAPAPGGGSLTFIGTQDANNSAVSMSQTGLTGFDTYMVVGSTIVPTINGGSLFIRLGEDGYSEGSTDYRWAGGRLSDIEATNSEGKVFSRTSTGASSIEIPSGGVGNGSVGAYLNFVAYICTAPSGDSKSSIFGIGSSLDNGTSPQFRTFFWGGFLNVGSKTVNRVQIFGPSTIVSGSMTVYGMKQS